MWSTFTKVFLCVRFFFWHCASVFSPTERASLLKENTTVCNTETEDTGYQNFSNLKVFQDGLRPLKKWPITTSSSERYILVVRQRYSILKNSPGKFEYRKKCISFESTRLAWNDRLLSAERPLFVYVPGRIVAKSGTKDLETDSEWLRVIDRSARRT